VTTQIEGGEAVVADGKLLRGRVCGRLQDGDTVVLFDAIVSKWLNPHVSRTNVSMLYPAPGLLMTTPRTK
jgi:hypothetical protein